MTVGPMSWRQGPPGPAPGDGVRDPEQDIGMGVLVFVVKSLAAAGGAGVFDESLVVEAEQGVVLTEHDVRCGCGGVVGD